MNTSCPIDENTMDNSVVRINSFMASMILLSFIVLDKYIFIGIITLDLALKLYNPKYSPGYTVSKKIRDLFGVEKHFINAAPKQFAMKLGFSFSLLIVLLTLMNMSQITLGIFSSIFLLLMFLEWGLDYCIGCKLYALITSFSRK